MGAPDEVKKLVDNFGEHKEQYTATGGLGETEVRVQYIDPLFKALGWDIHNEAGRAEAWKHVVHEARIKVGKTTKAPDYAFRVGGKRVFFLEAKKPSVYIKNEPGPAYQLRRYAWSAKLPISILTDFEEFAVYDTTLKPSPTDKAGYARVEYLTFDKYVEHWDMLYGTFSYDAIERGGFDKYAKASRKKKGTAQVDDAFLKEIEGWRELLAKNIARNNSGLTVRDLNYAVQQTIDRIIFLRICEDRGIEPEEKLRGLQNGKNVYDRLGQIFQAADDRYNSGLFHFKQERDREEPPDEMTLGLSIDDKPLKEIFDALYFPKSPYQFSEFPADMLGQVYERFLGKVIRLTKGHQAKVEDKPEVKKAGGVFYTPTYIVDYIVKNTVGKLLEGKTPKQAAKLKILDPACGSGSFLIGAYQYLLDWYRNEYEKKGGKAKKDNLYKGAGGEWRLTTDARKKILLNNIYGVDIDSQAVETTKLSLLLKVLEGESDETITSQMKLYHQRALPDLRQNIKCGNSLIGPDFYDGESQSDLFDIDEEERYRINVFDWESEFAEIFKAGGFDAVIGNPPYVGFHGFKKEKSYLSSKYSSAKGKFDLYVPFIERGIEFLTANGLFGYICPSNFTKRDHGKALRNYLFHNISFLLFCDFKDKQIFKGALNYTCILILENKAPTQNDLFLYKQDEINDKGFQVGHSDLGSATWTFSSKKKKSVLSKILRTSNYKLKNITEAISEGIVTGNNDIFLLNAKDVLEKQLESELLKKCVRGKHLRRYSVGDSDEYVFFPYKDVNNKTKALSASEVKKFANTWKYLLSKRKDLSGRGYFEKSSKEWYELWCQRKISNFTNEKILVPELAESNRFCLSLSELHYGDTVCGITLKEQWSKNLKYVLGFLNSKLLEFYYKGSTVPKANKFYIYKTMFLNTIPIYFDNEDFNFMAKHDKMVKLVDRMLDLNKKLEGAKSPHDKTRLTRDIDATDRQIDALVYDLYDLTPAEIKIVEGATG